MFVCFFFFSPVIFIIWTLLFLFFVPTEFYISHLASSSFLSDVFKKCSFVFIFLLFVSLSIITLFFPSSFFEIYLTYSTIWLNWTAQWFDLHASWNAYHSTFSEHESTHTHSKLKKKERKNFFFFLVIRTRRKYSLNNIHTYNVVHYISCCMLHS